jgi:hypothetical protein
MLDGSGFSITEIMEKEGMGLRTIVRWRSLPAYQAEKKAWEEKLLVELQESVIRLKAKALDYAEAAMDQGFEALKATDTAENPMHSTRAEARRDLLTSPLVKGQFEKPSGVQVGVAVQSHATLTVRFRSQGDDDILDGEVVEVDDEQPG